MSSPEKYAVGDAVLLTQLRRRGTITEGPNRKGEYLVAVSTLTIWVAPDKFTRAAHVDAPKQRVQGVVRRSAGSVSADSEHRVLRIDLHGMRREEALRKLEDAVDKTLRGDAACIEVVHGLGKGTLKEAVHEYLRKTKAVKNYRVDTANPGVTWVYF